MVLWLIMLARYSLETLKSALEAKLGVELTQAATAIPPGILEGNTRCIVNCVEGADLSVIKVMDERRRLRPFWIFAMEPSLILVAARRG